MSRHEDPKVQPDTIMPILLFINKETQESTVAKAEPLEEDIKVSDQAVT